MGTIGGNPLLQAALDYARLGLPVAPLHVYKDGRCSCGDTRPHKAGKHPRTPHGVKDATRVVRQIVEWWQKWPDANIMGAMPAGVYVLEIDSAAAIQDLASRGVPMDGPRARTARGVHVWYRGEKGLPNCPDGLIAPDVGFRGVGEYVVMPPSLHPTGARYSWDVPFGGDLATTLPEVPKALLDLIKARRPQGPGGRWKGAFDTVKPGQQALTLLSLCRHAMQTIPKEKWPAEVPAILQAAAAKFPLGDPRWPWTEADIQRIYTQVAGRVDQAPLPPEPPGPAPSGNGEIHEDTEGAPGPTPAEAKGPANEKEQKRPDPWPDPLDNAAFHGPLGELTRLIEPETEADPAAILGGLLVTAGAVIGPAPYTLVGNTRHSTVLYGALVGRSAVGRKGTARDAAKGVFSEIDPRWVERRMISGLSSGEGLIREVRDPRPAESSKEKDDPGEPDKRLLVVENELARTLRAGARKDSVLTPIITDAWDGKPLATRIVSKAALRASTHHICFLGMITRAALAKEFSANDMASGFANRFLWFLTRRQRTLPDGGRPVMDIPGVPEAVDLLAKAIAKSRRVGRMIRDEAAARLWAYEYINHLSVERPGLLGDVTNRAEAIALRLSMIYALLDGDDTIREVHVRAAVAVVDYSLRSCAILFGGKTGNHLADRILRALPPGGGSDLTQTEIYSGVFGRNVLASEIAEALALLEDAGLIYSTEEETGGKRVKRWRIRRTH